MKALQSRNLGISAFPPADVGEAYQKHWGVPPDHNAAVDWDYVGRACRKVPMRNADDDEGERGKRAGTARPREAILDEVMREAPTDSTRMAIVDAIGPYRLEATQYMDDGTHMTSHSEGAFRGAEALTVSHNESQQEVRPGRGKTAITAFGYTHA